MGGADILTQTNMAACPLPSDFSTQGIHSFLIQLHRNASVIATLEEMETMEVMNDDAFPCMCNDLDKHTIEHYRFAVTCLDFPFQHEIWIQAFYITLFSLTIFMALVGNFTVMWIVLRHKTMRTVTNYYLFNLAVADATISIFNTGFSWTYNFYYQWIFGLFYCRVNNLMGITPICASVFTMIVMSIERYWAIVHPLRRRPGKKATVAVICLVWFLAIICGIPSFLLAKLERRYFFNGDTLYEHVICLSDDYPEGFERLGRAYTTGLVIVQYFLPLLILSCAYFRVGTVLRRGECVGDSMHAKSLAAKKKAAFMLALVVFIFMVVWFPYNTYFVLSDYLPKPDNHMTDLYIYINIYWLGMSSTLFNPVIYYFMNRKFRVGFRYAFRFLPCIKTSRADYKATLSSNTRPSIMPAHTTHTASEV